MGSPTPPDLNTIVLERGAHASREDGVCMMELVAWIAGREHTDAPPCVSPAIGSFLRAWNDGLPDDDRQTLKPYAPLVINTATTEDDEQRRAWLATDWLVRVFTPTWLDKAGLTERAQKLRDLPELASPELATAAANAQPEVETVTVEVSVLTDEHLERLEGAIGGLVEAADRTFGVMGVIKQELAKLQAPAPRGQGEQREVARPAGMAPAARPPARPPAPAAQVDGDFRPSGPQQRILDALAALELVRIREAHKTQLALFAQASPRSSSYTNNLGSLRTAGLIDYPRGGYVTLTDAGRANADAGQAPSTVDELQRFVYGLVGGAKARLLEHLISVYPESLSKVELAERAGASATSSSYTNNLGSLRSLGLIDYPGPGLVSALPVLFFEGA